MKIVKTIDMHGGKTKNQEQKIITSSNGSTSSCSTNQKRRGSRSRRVETRGLNLSDGRSIIAEKRQHQHKANMLCVHCLLTAMVPTLLGSDSE